MIYLRLFLEFFKTGLFSFGGGLATIPFLYEMAERTGWFTSSQLTDMIAISESTPGPVGINMATFAGYTVAGVPGGILATTGLIAPSVIIILIIARILVKFQENRLVNSAFSGLRPASVGLISAAGFQVMKLSLLHLDRWALTKELVDLFHWKAILLAVVIFFLVRKFKGHPILYLVGSAVIGMIFKFAA